MSNPERGIVLSESEARAVCLVLYAVGGKPQNTRRHLIDAVRGKLMRAYGFDDEYTAELSFNVISGELTLRAESGQGSGVSLG